MTLPQRINYITLGARNMPTLRGFYTGLGWNERPGSNDTFATYELGAVILALYPIDLLGAEAAAGEMTPSAGWNGVTLGVNVESPRAVDEIFSSAVAVGGRAAGGPTKREWGGYSGYVADPEGNRWEIAWAPE